MIEKLTPEQESKIQEYRDRYFAQATSCEPADRPRAEAAARRMKEEKTADNTIIITDEQDCSGDNSPRKAKSLGNGYIINVSVNENGIAYNSNWTHINGFSENCLTYIRESEIMNSNRTY